MVLALCACSNHGGGGSGSSADPTVITRISSDNAAMVASSSLDMVARLVYLGNVTNAMVQQWAGLISGPEFDGKNIKECINSPAGYNFETNQIDYIELNAGFNLPAGPSLHTSFVDCTIQNLRVTGFLDIAGITLTGDPTAAGTNWSIQAIVAMSPIDMFNDDGSETSILNKFSYTAVMSNGTLTTNLVIAQDPGAGQIGGLNAQHFVDPIGNPTLAINYQIRPFSIVMIEDANTYSVTIVPHPVDGASSLERYTTDPSGDIRLSMATTVGVPILWTGGVPAHLTDTPISGEVRISEVGCSGCGNILATVEPTAVDLTVNDGAAITTQSIDWATLFSTPVYN